jgi:hypothetical protein
MKWIKRIAVTLGVIYLLLCGALFFTQESLIFHPRHRPVAYSYGSYPEEWIEMEDGIRLHALHLKQQAAKGVVLYLHGNVGDNGRSLYQTKSIAELGYDLFLVDYRGFGKSEGSITSETDMTTDLQTVYDRLKATYGEEQIVIAGYSLGSGPASFLAANNKPKAVVLVAPYTSLTDMKNLFFGIFPDFLLKYELNNLANLGSSRSPVHILHGSNDELIPLSMGRALRAVDPTRIRLSELSGTGHRGAILHRRFGEVMAEVTR